MLRRSFLCLLPFALTAAPGPGFAGAAACRPCHAAIFQVQSASQHARALAPSSSTQPPEWAFGAGVQAITFVRRLDAGTLPGRRPQLVSRAGQPSTSRPAIATPTESATASSTPPPESCAASRVTPPARSRSMHGEGIVPAELGVRCESCHGPAAAHVRDPARVKPRNPGKFTAARLNDFCGGCHRKPAAADDTPDLRNPWNARHQPLGLAASYCFKASQGKLSCLTCHSPHAASRTETCRIRRRLHSLPSRRKAYPGCRRTSMRRSATCRKCRVYQHLTFANHRIAIYPK